MLSRDHSTLFYKLHLVVRSGSVTLDTFQLSVRRRASETKNLRLDRCTERRMDWEDMLQENAYLSTHNAGLPENQRSNFYMHTRHFKHINEIIYQTPLPEAEVSVGGGFRLWCFQICSFIGISGYCASRTRSRPEDTEEISELRRRMLPRKENINFILYINIYMYVYFLYDNLSVEQICPANVPTYMLSTRALRTSYVWRWEGCLADRRQTSGWLVIAGKPRQCGGLVGTKSLWRQLRCTEYVRVCAHIMRPRTETADHRRGSKNTKCPGWIKLGVILEVCTSIQRHTWRVMALSTMCATTVDVLILPGGKHWTLPIGTSHQDESDDELDGHQDGDRTDPERTD